MLTLRRLKVLISHLPEDSALARISNENVPLPTVEVVLLSDIWQQLAAQAAKPGSKVPKHPIVEAMTAGIDKRRQMERRSRIDQANRENLERIRAIEAGEIT